MNLVDLFSGCGGFSLGARQAGFRVVSAYDNDRILSSSYSLNFPESNLHLKNIAKLSGAEVRREARQSIDGIFGGPPCQGFSDIGKREPRDPRRQLLGHFFRIVNEVEPTFFVMENVRGLAYADARVVLDRALRRVSDRYAILGPQIWEASDFGAATKRPRLFVIGVHKDRGDAIEARDIEALKCPAPTVKAAIADLAGAEDLGEIDGFDTWRITHPGRPSDYARMLRAADGRFTGQKSTAHTPTVIKRFSKVHPGSTDVVGRHPRLSWDGLCPTLRAGTGADRGSYQSVRPIHPEENRVITVREAARLQGFPDAHRFHPTVWHSFRMIGNSVSPFMAKAIFSAIQKKLGVAQGHSIAAE
ncbi:MAG: DNA cytosine methyltransferase [Hyphomonadaceae bacterium]|nr:DNA cytosine methyltransferase [Hyphomonadaceae bacterium]